MGMGRRETVVSRAAVIKPQCRGTYDGLGRQRMQAVYPSTSAHLPRPLHLVAERIQSASTTTTIFRRASAERAHGERQWLSAACGTALIPRRPSCLTVLLRLLVMTEKVKASTAAYGDQNAQGHDDPYECWKLGAEDEEGRMKRKSTRSCITTEVGVEYSPPCEPLILGASLRGQGCFTLRVTASGNGKTTSTSGSDTDTDTDVKKRVYFICNTTNCISFLL